MTARPYKVTKLESDIDRLRSDGNWSRLMDLSKQNTVKSTLPENMVKFLQVESKVERCLTDATVTKNSCTPTQYDNLLVELNDLTNTNLKKDLDEELLLLRAKVYYTTSNFTEPLTLYQIIDLPSLPTTKVSGRRLRLLGEAFAIKGFCLERMPDPDENLVIECFENSGQISLQQLQERQEQSTKTLGSTDLMNDLCGLSSMVEQALFRYPILYIRKGELQTGIKKLRDLIMAIECRTIQGLRVSLTKQLAEILLRGVCGVTYVPPSTENSLSPLSYRNVVLVESVFVPKEKDEEALLLLLISESMAAREVVLNRSTELSEARNHTLGKAISVYDLLTICLARNYNYNILSETFEKATRFSFNEHYVWFQFALSLICADKFNRAYLVLKECMRLKPDDVTQKLLAANLCYQHLNLVKEGLEHSQEAVEIVIREDESSHLLSRCHLHVGIGKLMQSYESHLMKHKTQLMEGACEAFQLALSLDPYDYLCHFYTAYYLAVNRKIDQALASVRKALKLRRDHLHSLHLLILLLTANNMTSQASALLDSTINEFPYEFSLLFTKSSLDLRLGRQDSALQVNRRMLVLWKQLFQQSESEDGGTGLLDRYISDQRSLLHYCDMADRESEIMVATWRAESAGASKLEQALSEVASSVGSNAIANPGPHHSLQSLIWLSLAEVYLTLKKLDSAKACVDEAFILTPMSHVLFFVKGQLAEARGKPQEAQQFYFNAVSINPRHVKSLTCLGVLLHKIGNDRLAEMMLRKAINTDHMSTSSWRALGQVLHALGNEKEAAECLSAALSLQASSPVLPFHVIQAHCV